MATVPRAALSTSGTQTQPVATAQRSVIMSEAHVDAVDTHAGDDEEQDDDVDHTVFEGSSQEDVAHAKVFWSSSCLLPPVESSLVSVDIKQRLKVAKTPQHRG